MYDYLKYQYSQVPKDNKNDEQQIIPVVFAINNSYAKQLATVVISILENSNFSNKYEFNIMSKDLDIDSKNKLLSIKNKYNNIDFKFINMSKIVDNFDLEKYMSRRKNYEYISIETYFRFFIPELFPQYKKIIYLDADIIVLDDLVNLYNINIENYYAGVSHDIVIEKFIKNKKRKTEISNQDFKTYLLEKLQKTSFNYFNAGILLLNLELIRNNNIVENLWEFVAKESPLEFQDQDVLNAILDTKVKYIDYKWNVIKGAYHIAKYKNEFKKAYKKPAIFHYVSANKPWVLHYETSKYDYVLNWWTYYKKTPFYSNLDKDLGNHFLRLKNNEKIVNFISIILFNFKFLDINKINNRINITILGLIKLKIKCKGVLDAR